MARKKRTLNDESSEVIEKNFLEEVPVGVPTEDAPVVVAQEIPQTSEIVFLNNRDPGCPVYFHYHSKTHPLHHYTLMHGCRYTLPNEVINHLEGVNNFDPWSCHTRKYARRMREDGVSETYANAYVPNFQCKQVR